jgi:hypothetical protein
MPIAAYKENADSASKANTESVREKLMKNVQDKFLCGFRGNVAPKEFVFGPDGNVTGLKVIGTKIEGRKVIELPGTEEVIPTTLIVSSIGSIPEPIPSLPTKGEFYDFADWDLGRFADLPEFFGVGNVVTGQGNIAISRKHAKSVSDALVARYMGVGDGPLNEPGGVLQKVEARGAAAADAVTAHVQKLPKLDAAKLAALEAKVQARQKAVGYGGDLKSWIAAHTPPDRV